MPYRSDPYGNLAGSINDLATNLIRVRGQNLSQTLGEAQLGMEARRLGEAERQHNIASWGTETSQTGTPTLQMRSVQTAEAEQAAKEAKDPNIMPLKRTSVLKSMIGLKTNLGLDDKDVGEIFNPMLEMAGMPRGQAYDMLKTQGPQLNQIFLQKVSDAYEKKLSDPKNGMAFAQSPQAKAMEEFIDHLDSDKDLSKTVNSVFPDIVRHRAEVEENSKAAMLAARLAYLSETGKPDRKAMEAWTRLSLNGGNDYEGKAEDAATVAAFQKLNTEEARKNLAGRAVNIERAPKISANVAINPVSGESEYLMTDGSFSGKKATSKEKQVTVENLKHLADMVSVATNKGKDEPTASDIELIGAAAAPLGYEFKKTTKEEPGAIFGTNTKESWDLVQKKGATRDKKDPFGYTVGQTTAKGGKTYKYIGNNKWQAQ